MSVVRRMFYGSFGSQNAMVAFISRFGRRKGHYKIKLGQKTQIFKKKSSKNMPILSSFFSHNSKNVIYVYVRQ